MDESPQMDLKWRVKGLRACSQLGGLNAHNARAVACPQCSAMPGDARALPPGNGRRRGPSLFTFQLIIDQSTLLRVGRSGREAWRDTRRRGVPPAP